jgi:hypothetical protein
MITDAGMASAGSVNVVARSRSVANWLRYSTMPGARPPSATPISTRST